MLSIGGVALISFASQDANGANTPFGLLMCMASTFLYAIVELICGHINTSHFSADHPVVDSMLFQGLTGVAGILCGWIVIIIWNYTGWEVFVWPSASIWGDIFIMAGLNTLFFFVFIVGTVCTSAVFMATGSLLVIPASFIISAISSKAIPNGGSIIGAFMICLGFLLMELPIFDYIRKLLGWAKVETTEVSQKMQFPSKPTRMPSESNAIYVV